MTIGPAPMIRIELISVRLGILCSVRLLCTRKAGTGDPAGWRAILVSG